MLRKLFARKYGRQLAVVGAMMAPVLGSAMAMADTAVAPTLTAVDPQKIADTVMTMAGPYILIGGSIVAAVWIGTSLVKGLGRKSAHAVK